MNPKVPNILTIIRIILVPFFIFFALQPHIVCFRYLAIAVFVIASLTDYFDGHLARKYNIVSNFGKFIDPLADKILVNSALIILLVNGRIHVLLVLIVLFREFIISGFRLVAVEKGVVIAANIWGKMKTAFQMFSIIYLLFNFQYTGYLVVETVIQIIIAALTVVSLIIYLIQNKSVLKD